MHEFRVWAPKAKQGCGEDGRGRMRWTGPDERGWWSVRWSRRGRERTMGFVLDDDPTAYPDPRSQWQPQRSAWIVARVRPERRLRGAMSGWQAPPLASAIIV